MDTFHRSAFPCTSTSFISSGDLSSCVSSSLSISPYSHYPSSSSSHPLSPPTSLYFKCFGNFGKPALSTGSTRSGLYPCAHAHTNAELAKLKAIFISVAIMVQFSVSRAHPSVAPSPVATAHHQVEDVECVPGVSGLHHPATRSHGP